MEKKIRIVLRWLFKIVSIHKDNRNWALKKREVLLATTMLDRLALKQTEMFGRTVKFLKSIETSSCRTNELALHVHKKSLFAKIDWGCDADLIRHERATFLKCFEGIRNLQKQGH